MLLYVPWLLEHISVRGRVQWQKGKKVSVAIKRSRGGLKLKRSGLFLRLPLINYILGISVALLVESPKQAILNLRLLTHGLILGDFKQLIGGRNNPIHLLAIFAELKFQWRMFKRQFFRFGYVWDEIARAAKIAAVIQCTASRSGELWGSQWMCEWM